MKNSSLEIKIDDITLEVEYYFDHGSDGDYFDPPTSDVIDIESVRVEGSKLDITDLLADYVINRIEDKIYHYEKMA